MTTSFHALLDEIRDAKRSEKDVGDRFEEIVQVYFNHDSQMQQMYSQAMSWKDWVTKYREEESIKDVGIDLVAQVRDGQGNGFAAIQAKCRQKNYKLQKKDIDSFYSTADSKGFKTLIFVDTTEVDPSPHFQDVVDGRQITHIRVKDLVESTVDWESFIDRGEKHRRKPKEPRPHQLEAVEHVREGLDLADRGQIIMACGTGKTYTGLLIAERLFGVGTRVLVLVPSLALMSQMIREWHADATVLLRSYSVCSDSEVGRRGRSSDDIIQLTPSELKIPPTTSAESLAEKASSDAPDAITVVFGTYHSIAVVHAAQHEHGLPEFDLIVCDEAHRTTGQFDEGKEEQASMFVLVHDAEYVRSRKRLYMTATPRIYTPSSKSIAAEGAITLCSMDNPDQFGNVLFYKSFAWAVENELLSDYRVIVLALDEQTISNALQKLLESDDSDIKLDDATKIVGCYKALMKDAGPDRADEFKGDSEPSRRALAFCNTIKNSKIISGEFNNIVQVLVRDESKSKNSKANFDCSTQHIDGTSGAHNRNNRLSWLGDEPKENELRILSNVRCLGEGVDVPSLDAIVFFHPRKSQIDVVQAVGRVMRRAPGKKYGYVVLPVAIPAGKNPVESLKDNKTYETVWQILNALRSHDERLEAEINRLQLEGEDTGRIFIGLPETASGMLRPPTGGGGGTGPEPKPDNDVAELPFDLHDAMVQEFSSAVFAQIVRKVGRMSYWEDWAHDVGKIAQTQITRIRTALASDEHSQSVFQNFLAELQDDLNPSVTQEQAIELLAQHVITRPVFNALFEGHKFIQQNSVSIAMEEVLNDLDKRNLEKETESLQSFYDEVKWRIKGTKTAGAKQQLVKELYDKFFRKAFPRTTEMLGIAFTPVEIVDYMIHSIEHLLKKHFQTSMSDENVHIIDPFVGTGTFITRLLQSGIIRPEDLCRKYEKEIHANEIVLLAYYVAGINIEAVYHDVRGEENGEYEPYERIVFQDTFQSSEQENQLNGIFPFNHERIEYQQKLPLTVVLGNPPYSKGQKTADENAANLRYPALDSRIKSTYASAAKNVGNKNSLYDSYVRAFRWASDRLGERGIVGFVTGAGWLDGKAAAGIRTCFSKEFSHVYVLNLRGNGRCKGEQGRKEGGLIFDQASRLPITVTFLVKDGSKKASANIQYHDIGDYLKRDQKLGKLNEFESIENTPLVQIKPNTEQDWINQRVEEFYDFIPLIPEKNNKKLSIFRVSSSGLKSHRDTWVYNFSKNKLAHNVTQTIDFFNSESERYFESNRTTSVLQFVEKDRTKIAWTPMLARSLESGKKVTFFNRKLFLSEYRPFTKTWCYFDTNLLDRPRNLPEIFKTPEEKVRMLCTSSGGGGSPDLASWVVDHIPDSGITIGSKCFPISVPIRSTSGVFKDRPDSQHLNYGEAIKIFQQLYPRVVWHDHELFCYVYGVLTCPEYIAMFRNSLGKTLPRIPCVATEEDFKAFAYAGRQLVTLHAEYDQAKEFPVTESWADKSVLEGIEEKNKYRVERMKFVVKSDRSTIQYNPVLKISGIPEEAYEFKVGGWSLVEWVMDRQRVTKHKDSGIVNDANDFAHETMGDPSYPLRLLKKAITVGIKTREIQKSMPPLRIHKKMS